MTTPEGDDLRGKEASIRVNQFRSSRILFQRNFEELVTFLDYLCAPQVAFSYSPVEQKWLWYAGMQEVVRLLHNFVAAALSLVDHTRVLYRQLYEPSGHLSEYESKVATEFAQDSLTQFVIKLRQMAQHYRLPSLENHTEVCGIKNGIAGEVRIQLRLTTEDLRQFDSWNAPATKFLETAGAHIDLRTVVAAYHDHVVAFYEWFEQRQRDIHGIGPDLLRHLSMHGLAVGPRKEIEQLASGVSTLAAKPRESLTFADLEEAFAPVLSVLDVRRLLLCRHDGKVWIATALIAAKTHFPIPADLEAQIRSLIA